MHVALDPPLGEPPTGRLRPGSTIALNRSSTYPSTEQTLSSLSVVVNAGGLGQIGDFIHSTATALSGREGEIRELITRLGHVRGNSRRATRSVQCLDSSAGSTDQHVGGAKGRHHRRAAHCATGPRRLVGGAGQAGHRHAEARRVQRHRNRTRQHHPGRPGEKPDQSRTDPESAGRRRPRTSIPSSPSCRRFPSRRTSSTGQSAATTSTSSRPSI